MSTSQTERQNGFGKVCKQRNSLDGNLEGDSGFAGLINSTEYLVDEAHEMVHILKLMSSFPFFRT